MSVPPNRIDAIESGAKIEAGEARDMAREIRRLRKAVLTARNAVVGELAKTVAHVHENARALAVYGGDAKVEARCREMAAVYLEEALEVLGMDDREHGFDGVFARPGRLEEKLKASIAVIDAAGGGEHG